MANIVRWEPFRDIVSLRQAMGKLLEDSFVHPAYIWPELRGDELALDMYQTKDDIVVKTALPGIKPEEVDISITGDTLTIKGEHKEEQEVKEEDYMRKECRYGAFARSIVIPVQVKADKAEATFENGVLTLTIPKTEAVKPKQIKVKAESKAK